MKQISTIFLRLALILMAIGVLAICALLLPTLWKDIDDEFPAYAFSIHAVFIAIYAAAVPFFVGVYNAWKLLGQIDRGLPFTPESVKVIKNIAISAGCISAIYIVSLPFFYIWADNDDAPGLVIIGMVLVGAPMVVAVFAALLQRLISEAVELKAENELTV